MAMRTNARQIQFKLQNITNQIKNATGERYIYIEDMGARNGTRNTKDLPPMNAKAVNTDLDTINNT
jgi:sulfur transfer complex TusBCD TusB component (DsrH family)